MAYIFTREITNIGEEFYVRFKEVNVYSYIYNYESNDAFYYVPNILKYSRDGRTINSDPIILKDGEYVFESFMGCMNDFYDLYDMGIINYGDFVYQLINDSYYIIYSKLAAFYLYPNNLDFFCDPREEIEKHRESIKFFVGIIFSDPTGMRISFFRTDDDTFLPFYEDEQYRPTVDSVKLFNSLEEAAQTVQEMYNSDIIMEAAKAISKLISGRPVNFEMIISSNLFEEVEKEYFDI